MAGATSCLRFDTNTGGGRATVMVKARPLSRHMVVTPLHRAVATRALPDVPCGAGGRCHRAPRPGHWTRHWHRTPLPAPAALHCSTLATSRTGRVSPTVMMVPAVATATVQALEVTRAAPTGVVCPVSTPGRSGRHGCGGSSRRRQSNSWGHRHRGMDRGATPAPMWGGSHPSRLPRTRLSHHRTASTAAQAWRWMVTACGGVVGVVAPAWEGRVRLRWRRLHRRRCVLHMLPCGRPLICRRRGTVSTRRRPRLRLPAAAVR